MNIDKHRNEKVWPPGFPQGITEQLTDKDEAKKIFLHWKKESESSLNVTATLWVAKGRT